MITLYVKTNCAFSAMVLKKVEDLGLAVEEKNIADPAVADELMAKGGKLQTPYLVDDENLAGMYESSDIVAHLEKHYGSGEGLEVAVGVAETVPAFRLHRSDDENVCDGCQ